MDKKVAELLNAQVNKELYSAYLYVGISQFFEVQKLHGFASWYMVQSKEELEHAEKFYNYLIENDETVGLDVIAGVSSEYEDASVAVKAADDHEHYITAEINKIYDAAVEAKDYRTQNFLNWFITEQEEEEKNSQDMIDKVALLGSDPKNLYLLDKELADRK